MASPGVSPREHAEEAVHEVRCRWGEPWRWEAMSSPWREKPLDAWHQPEKRCQGDQGPEPLL